MSEQEEEEEGRERFVGHEFGELYISRSCSGKLDVGLVGQSYRETCAGRDSAGRESHATNERSVQGPVI